MSSASVTKVDAELEKKLQLVCKLFQAEDRKEIHIGPVNLAVVATFGLGSSLKKKDITVNGSSWGLEWGGTSGHDCIRYNPHNDLRSNSIDPSCHQMVLVWRSSTYHYLLIRVSALQPPQFPKLKQMKIDFGL
jgi:hypothetical protein